MRYEILGPLVVLDDSGSDVTPRGPQLRRLLTSLVTAGPSGLTVDTLGDVLWPDGAPSANALQAQISKLRRAIDGVVITVDGRGYTLAVDERDSIDVRDFEHLVAEAGQLVREGDPERAIERYGQALELVRGDPLADIADSPFGRGPATRMAAIVRGARAARLEAELDVGRLADVAAQLEALVATEPLDEHWWALLMLARYRQGRQAEALRAYQEARRVLAAELGLEPGPALKRLEQQILDHDPELIGPRHDGPRRSHAVRRVATLPTRLTSLVGRDALLGELAVDLACNRLVTLLGPGGAGKTSTALELARRTTGRAVVLVELSPVVDADAIPAVVAGALGLAAADAPVAGAATSTIDRLVDAIVGEPMLVVLDNCEHVVDAVAKLAHQLLEVCPELTLLATSREALNVPGEVVRTIPPLADDDAVALFRERAAAAAPGFRLDEAHEATVRAICARLDGLPLAIELAAARVRSLDPADLLRRLDDRFVVLSAGSRTLEPRQQTLRAVVDWSHDLLDEVERIVFRRLAAFQGGATLPAAEAVCSDGWLVSAREVAGTIERLIDKSIVIADRRSGTTRYRMLQTLADYAAERLRDSGEVERVRQRHAEHMADLVAPAMHGLLGSAQQHWIATIDAERENVRAALDIAVARGDAQLALRITAPIGWYFYMVAQTEVGAAALEDALSCPGASDPSLRALTLAHFGWLVANGHGIDAALEATGEATALIPAVDDAWVETFVHVTRIMALFYAGRFEEALDVLPAMLDAADRSGDPWSAAICALVRGELARVHDTDDAEAAFFEAIDRLERVGDEFSLAITLTEAAEIAEIRGDYDAAAALLTRGMEMSERVGFSSHPLATRARRANVEALRGNLELAERMHLELLEEIGDDSLPWLRSISYVGLAGIGRRSGRLDDARRWLERALEIQRNRDVPLMAVLVHTGVGYTADQRGDVDLAWRHQREAVATAARARAPRVLANALEGAAGALALGGPDDHPLAAQLLGAADGLRRRSGGPMPAAERWDVDRAEARLRAALGDDGFDATFSNGAATPVDELVDRVLRRA